MNKFNLLAELADCAYWDVSDHDHTLPDICKVIDKVDIKETDTECMVVDTPYGRVFAYQGSASWSDWVSNFDFFQKKYPCKRTDESLSIHSGFMEAFQSIEEKLFPYQLTDLPIIYTGHSRGGALAALSALYLPAIKDVSVVTFGAPKSMSSGACESFKRLKLPYHRFVMHGDVVPSVPAITGRHPVDPIVLGKSFLSMVLSVSPVLYKANRHSMETYRSHVAKWVKSWDK